MHGMTSDRDTDARAGEFVLGVADEADMARMEHEFQTDPEFARAVVQWRERLSALDRAAAPVEASSALWERIRHSVTTTPARQVPKAADRLPIWQSLSFWRGSALAGALASLLLAIGLGAVLTGTTRSPVVVAILEADDSTPGAIVEAFADGSIMLRPLQPIDVPDDKTLQVWTLWDRAVGPVPLGILGSLRQARFQRDGQPVPQEQQLYEITLEPKGGSPTGRPTGPILYKGLATSPL
jgi:anti-sigma-K factor RskA